MNKQKGFTIIELIVVIAIIAVLAAIVLVNVTQYINKSKTASIQANMSTLETNMATSIADSATGYGSTACAAVKDPIAAATLAAFATSALSCNGDPASSKWCSGAATPTAVDSTSTHTKWCVDSAGFHAWGTCSATTYVCAAS